MHHFTVSDSKDFLLNNGKPFFYFADTVWSAFTNAEFEEWEEYLDYRRAQNFNVLQINILPQWERCMPDLGTHPFAMHENGAYDFSQINAAYFDRVQQMLEMAIGKGFIPALVVLWSNYVKGTFFDNLYGKNVIPLENVKPYVEHAVNAFSKFNPIYFISGDTNFSAEAAEYYLIALETIKRIAPDALTTLHICGGPIDMTDPNPVQLPVDLLNSEYLDFYSYQSGHFNDYNHRAYEYAESFCRQIIKRPVINTEPCYEGWENGSRRFGSAEIRQTTWLSLLSGAKAGISYGAQGIWQWYKKGSTFSPSVNDGVKKLYTCKEPFEWRTALGFEGVWENSFAKWIFETYDLFGIKPKNIILTDIKEAKLSATEDFSKVAIYIPYSTDIEINIDLSQYESVIINLSNKHFGKPVIIFENGTSRMKQYNFNSDALVICFRA